jgi:tRNA threonylcarbamoyladenosine biosynthesis protein TsaE
MTRRIISRTDDQTRDLGYRLGQAVTGPLAIALTGDLGCGKTTFVKGLARGLGVDRRYPVTSPTFTLINEYPADKGLRLCHLDLYRLGSVEELAHTGFDDLADDDRAVIAVEWPSLLKSDRFAFDLELTFEFDSNYHRIICIFTYGQTGANMLCRWLS